MNFSNFCSVFCCPPWLPSIINKMAFRPPEYSSYSITKKSDGDLQFRFKAYMFGMESLPVLVAYKSYMVDCRGEKLALVYVKFRGTPAYTILYSHGNACDIGQSLPFLTILSQVIQCDIFVYDYNGYGASTGRPNEEGMRHNIECVYNYMVKELNVNPENIISFGQSIGSVPALYLATIHKVAGIILQSPLSSGLRLVFPHITKTFLCDPFQNIEMIKKVKYPIFIIHGLKDDVIPYDHGFALYENAPGRVDPLWLPNFNHNNVEQSPEYFPAMRRFIYHDLKKIIA